MSAGFKKRQRNPAEEVAEFKSKRGFTQKGVDDLVMLPKITEAEIVDNLHKRHSYDAIYTNIGPVLIVVNPYKDLGLTTDDYVRLYKGKFRHELPPHIFALSEETYRAMKNEKTDQCVIISGESGAGKTVAAKQIMQYIAAVSGHSDSVEFIKNVILDSNPLLEAFGNAKTIRNNNSSRFGKYFEIRFDQKGDPIGGKITNYLLEKSRVVYQQPGERNFHIFYQLLYGADQELADRLQLYSPENFHYVNQSQCYTVDGVDDTKEFQDVIQAMDTMGISLEERNTIFEIVAGILHIGNVPFAEDDHGNAYITDRTELEITAALWQVPVENLEYALTYRQMTSGVGAHKEVFQSPLNLVQADGTRNALAKDIYDRLFTWLVEKVNIALDKWKLPHVCVIGILDIFGFEIFDHNGFEQFCINYVNEKLQQYFIEKTLKEEQEEYVAEGIQWTPIKYFNNKIVCDLIEGKNPPGLFSLLDDTCATIHAQGGDATDEKFLQKANSIHSTHAHFHAFTGAFNIMHYAGEVTYEISGFTDKNKDMLFQECIDCMRASNSEFLYNLFPVTPEEQAAQSGQRKRPTTAGFKIKTSANLLMDTLSSCAPHYIRCIKPNDVKKPGAWEQERVRHQVQYLGLLENVKVRRAGYASRMPFDRFLRRYKKLSKKTWGTWGEWKGDPQEGAKLILEDLTSIEPGQWQFGKTKVFIRHPESVFHLEELVERKDFDEICKIQRAWRMWRMRRKALEQKAEAAKLLRGKKERRNDSMDRKWVGDYINYEDNFPLQDVMDPYKEELVVYADELYRLNKNGRLEKRFILLTDKAFYIVLRSVKKKVVSWSVTRRIPLNTIGSVALSCLQDGFTVIKVPSEYDVVLECDRRTELIMLLRENFKNDTGRELEVTFSDTITYKGNEKDSKMKTLQFFKDETAIPLLQQQASSSSKLKSYFTHNQLLKIGVRSGLSKDTDTTPPGYKNTMTRSGTGPKPGAGKRQPGNAALKKMADAGNYDYSAIEEREEYEEAAAAAAAPAPSVNRSMPARTGGTGGFAAQAAAARGGGAMRGAGTPRSGGAGAGAGGPRGGGAVRGAGGPRGGAAQGAGVNSPRSGAATPRSGPAQGAGAGAGAARGAGGPRGGAVRGAGGPRGGPAARALPKPAKPAKPKAQALYDYDASTPDELTFREGDILTVLQKDPGGWWEAELNGQKGWIPANYVQEC